MSWLKNIIRTGATISSVISLFFLAFIFMSVGMHDEKLDFDSFTNTVFKDYDTTTIIGCSSDSMGLTMDCNDKLYLKKVVNSSSLEIGMVYIYRLENITVSHRLVACVDSDCNLTVFKGDNNRYAEFVNFSSIIYRITKVEYRR